MVDFCGWMLPVQYKLGLIESHLHTRSKVSLFDVSHMGQLRVHGADRADFLESVVVGDIKGLQTQEARLTLLTNENGGIIDDLIITRQDDYFGVVVNAGCAEKDIAHFQDRAAAFRSAGKDVQVEVLGEQSLVALQGPESQRVLQTLLNKSDLDLSKLPFMHAKEGISVAGLSDNVWITRCGYTGEDGFEISAPSSVINTLTESIVGDGSLVKLAGLGARDSLRLEAGLCLYGNDIDDSTTPIEAGLAWTISKRRRAEQNFPGAQKIIKQLADGCEKKRVGLLVTGAPARQGSKIFVKGSNEEVGIVTSGSFSPCLGRPIAMGYVKSSYAKNGTALEAEVRGKKSSAEVTKMPFVSAHYYKLPMTASGSN